MPALGKRVEFFEFGLRCLLDGLEALADKRRRQVGAHADD